MSRSRSLSFAIAAADSFLEPYKKEIESFKWMLRRPRHYARALQYFLGVVPAKGEEAEDYLFRCQAILRAIAKLPKKVEPQKTLKVCALSPRFYTSKEWRSLRKKVLDYYGQVCMACGSTSNIHVDHIVPISWDHRLALCFDNLQVLCRYCNLSKGNRNATDFRK